MRNHYHMEDEVQTYLSNLPQWTKFFNSYRLPPVVNDEQAIPELRQRLANIRRRLRDGPEAPLRLAFFGPTGAGKSKLFGSLIGDNSSGSGFKRPFTRRSFYYVHDDWKPVVATLAGDTLIHDQPAWRDIILIDTPDFDSVETANRDEAERVFLESDGFLFITDSLKYADASTWEYLRKIRGAGKSFAVILNKVNSPTVSEGFRQRYERTFATRADYAEVVVPELPIDDKTLIPADHAAIRNLQQTARDMLGTGQSRREVSAALLGQEAEAFCSYADALRTRITGKCTQIDEARRELMQRCAAAERRLNARLSSDLEPAVRDSVYYDVIRRLEKIDVLRYPRRLLAMPIMGIKSLLGGWFSSASEPIKVDEPAFADPVSSETFHVLEAEMIAFADQSRNDIHGRPGLGELIDREVYGQLRFQHAEIEQAYIKHHERFANWVANHAQETAGEITGENKAKFILSQVLFNTVLITAQVKTMGGLSLLEVGLDGVISPLVAKGISMAIGSEKVKQFEQEAHAEHQRSLRGIMIQARQRFEAFLDQACEGLDELEFRLKEISGSRPHIDKLVAHFAGHDRRPEPRANVVEEPKP